RPEPSLRSPPSSGAIPATSLRDGALDDDDPAPRLSYSLRARDLPLSVARRSSQMSSSSVEMPHRALRAEPAAEKPPRPPARPLPEGALPRTRPPGPAISPRMTAIFGGLFGLAAITSVVAVLIQAAPPKNDRERMALSPASSAA